MSRNLTATDWETMYSRPLCEWREEIEKTKAGLALQMQRLALVIEATGLVIGSPHPADASCIIAPHWLARAECQLYLAMTLVDDMEHALAQESIGKVPESNRGLNYARATPND